MRIVVGIVRNLMLVGGLVSGLVSGLAAGLATTSCDNAHDRTDAGASVAPGTATSGSGPLATNLPSATPSTSGSAASSLDTARDAAPAVDAAPSRTAAPQASPHAIVDAASPLSDGGESTDGGTGPRPLFSWMKANMTPAFAAKDLPKVGELLDLVAKSPPPKMPLWTSIAKDGADAARAGKYDATKAACRSCHDQYKPRYIAEMRTRPFP